MRENTKLGILMLILGGVLFSLIIVAYVIPIATDTTCSTAYKTDGIWDMFVITMVVLPVSIIIGMVYGYYRNKESNQEGVDK